MVWFGSWLTCLWLPETDWPTTDTLLQQQNLKENKVELLLRVIFKHCWSLEGLSLIVRNLLKSSANDNSAFVNCVTLIQILNQNLLLQDPEENLYPSINEDIFQIFTSFPF